jgi:hypothetical protein
VRVHPAGPRRCLVAAVGRDGLQLAGTPQPGRELAAQAFVVFDAA